MNKAVPPSDLAPSTLLLVFSHLRWNFVVQRPHHLLSRAARHYRVVYLEEPMRAPVDAPRLQLVPTSCGVTVATPLLPDMIPDETGALAALVDQIVEGRAEEALVIWYYTPMALAFSEHLRPDLCIYDCMDELAAFRNPPPGLLEREESLFSRADIVFTGGRSLYEAKRRRHPNVFCFPSSIDAAQFRKAREPLENPADQARIAAPRIGFFGVIDERMDLDLVRMAAAALPEVQFVFLGPVAKIDPAELPQRENLHWLGGKSYDDLPAYLAHWQAGWMPFALNDATRFISPTKTPEFLAAGLPLVSTAVTDVVSGYGEAGLVTIASAANIVDALAGALGPQPAGWLEAVDRTLAQTSWDRTWAAMDGQIRRAQLARAGVRSALRSLTETVSCRARRPDMYDWLVVGAGFAGSVLAERIASQRNERVLVIDRRPHIAGNAFDHLDEAGLLIHRYGPHIFHTNSDAVVRYLSAFTDWRDYEHRVLAQVDDKLVPIPINLDTVNTLYGLNLSPEGMEDFLARRRVHVSTIVSSEDVVISTVGRELYEKFFRGYTRKQWGLDPSQLSRTVTARIPTRTNRDDRYFTDTFQKMPKAGYTRMFERMLNHPNIDVRLETDYREIRHKIGAPQMVFTGPIDEFFDFQLGRLPYRSLRFEHVTLDREWAQPVAVVNYPQTERYTRVTEYKHLTVSRIRRQASATSIRPRRATPTTRYRAPRTRSFTSAIRHLRRGPMACGSWDGWRPIATSTWIRSWARRWPSSTGSTPPARRPPRPPPPRAAAPVPIGASRRSDVGASKQTVIAAGPVLAGCAARERDDAGKVQGPAEGSGGRARRQARRGKAILAEGRVEGDGAIDVRTGTRRTRLDPPQGSARQDVAGRQCGGAATARISEGRRGAFSPLVRSFPIKTGQPSQARNPRHDEFLRPGRGKARHRQSCAGVRGAAARL